VATRYETTRNETHPAANDLAIRNGSGVLVPSRAEPIRSEPSPSRIKAIRRDPKRNVTRRLTGWQFATAGGF